MWGRRRTRRQRWWPWGGGGDSDAENGYHSDDESDASWDSRNLRNLQKPAPPAEDDFYDLVGPPTFGYRIQSATMPKKFMPQTSTSMMAKQIQRYG